MSESKAMAVNVAMSPRNIGSRYRGRPRPGLGNARATFLWETKCVKSNCARLASSAWRRRHWLSGVFKSWISDAHCSLQQKWQVLYNNEYIDRYTAHILVSWPNPMLYPFMFFSVGSLPGEGSAFVQTGVPSCSNDVKHRSWANFKCEVADATKQICIDFRGTKCVYGECFPPYLIYLVRLFGTAGFN